MDNRYLLKSEKGFTLIEIIAVLIILGILAAVAVPKFMNLTDEARDKAALQAVAEGQSRLSMKAAQLILSNGVIPLATDLDDVGVISTDAGDYSLTFVASDTDNVDITAAGKAPVTGNATGSWRRPTN